MNEFEIYQEFNKWMDSDNDNYIDGECHVVD